MKINKCLLFLCIKVSKWINHKNEAVACSWCLVTTWVNYDIFHLGSKILWFY